MAGNEPWQAMIRPAMGALAAMLILGEVRTSLLPNSAALRAVDGERALALTAGADVLRSDRPISIVTSPERLTGVDCQVPVAARRTARAVGTVASRAVLTGGHILQGSTRTVVDRSAFGRRLPWSHYLARRGTIEVMGSFREDDLATAFLAAVPAAPLLDMSAIGAHTMERVRGSAVVDLHPPLRSGQTRLRWAALLPPGDATADSGTTESDSIAFVLDADGRRTVRLRAHGAAAEEAAALCEDLALHDWLLTTLTGILERSGPDLTGTGPGAARIRSVVDHLLHLWMPGARLDTAMRRFWTRLEDRAGFGRQWAAAVQRIRDHLAMSTLQRLGGAAS